MIELELAAVLFGLLIDQGEDAFGPGKAFLNAGVHAGKRTEPIEERQQRNHVRRELRGVEASHLALFQRDIDDDSCRAGDHELQQRRARGTRRRLLAHRLTQLVCAGNRPRSFVVFSAEDLDHALGADDFLENVSDRACELLHVARDTTQPPAEIANHDDNDRHDDDQAQRPPPVEPEHEPELTRDRQRAAHRSRDRRRGGRGELIGVEGELRDQPSRRLRIEV